MKRREAVILALAAAGLLYAVWALFLAPAPGDKAGGVVLDRAGLAKTATEVKDLVAKSQPTAHDLLVLARAASPFPRDPFHRTTSPGEGPVSGTEAEAVFVYSGYLEMEGVRFAIVNGLEYRVGDELETPGYFLAGIERNRVTIEHRIPGQAASGRIVAPLVEADTYLDNKESKGNGTAR
ncbi:MAG: hypothetical protein AB1916_11275 [Thermodesulfobacteriota bacterium]